MVDVHTRCRHCYVPSITICFVDNSPSFEADELIYQMPERFSTSEPRFHMFACPTIAKAIALGSRRSLEVCFWGLMVRSPMNTVIFEASPSLTESNLFKTSHKGTSYLEGPPKATIVFQKMKIGRQVSF